MTNHMFDLLRSMVCFIVLLSTVTVRCDDLPVSLDQLPPTDDVPNLFAFRDGTRVETAEDWARRRQELIAALMFYQYGRIPPAPDKVTVRTAKRQPYRNGPGIETALTLLIDSEKQLEMRLVVYSPETPGPHPVIIREEGSLGGSSTAELFLKYNYLFVEYARHDLDPDRKDTVGPAQRAYPDYDWATLAVWAWGGMRVVDYLETRDDVDMQRIAITGHSRGGKMALLAAALDKRFALAVPNGSGAGGAGASRVLGPGAESIGMNDKPHWYHERIRMFAEREAHLPIDQHFLKALIAPRALLCIESTDDLFANPEGTLATSRAAMPAFELFGRRQANGLIYRRGGHTFSQDDWQALLEFAEWTFFDEPPSESRSFWQTPADILPQPNSGGPETFLIVPHAGNEADKHRSRVGAIGAVAHEFEIAKYKVSNRQYAEFLNAVAATADPFALYDPRMRIQKQKTKTGKSYRASPGSKSAAVTFVSWDDALRYCNWRHGGATETGVYTMQADGNWSTRSATAKYFLPTEHEWYKAAYFDPQTSTWHQEPLRNVHKIHDHTTLPTKSRCGMLGAADPIWEWNESQVGAQFRGLRSDSWFQGNNRQAWGRFYSNPDMQLGHIGFRIARSISSSAKGTAVD